GRPAASPSRGASPENRGGGPVACRRERKKSPRSQRPVLFFPRSVGLLLLPRLGFLFALRLPALHQDFQTDGMWIVGRHRGEGGAGVRKFLRLSQFQRQQRARRRGPVAAGIFSQVVLERLGGRGVALLNLAGRAPVRGVRRRQLIKLLPQLEEL